MPTISLPSKPGAELFYEFTPSSKSSDLLIVFVNGLVAPAMGWKPTIGLLKSGVSTLIYDRFGQGATTARDPTDTAEGKTGPYGHTYLDVVKDLHELIHTVAAKHASKLLLVGNSIGVHIVRLYTQHYPDQVLGALFLDSNIANKEFHDMWPNPNDPGFDFSSLQVDDVTLEQYQEICKKLPGMFDPTVPTPEGLDRRNQRELLPQPDGPKLLGSDGKGIYLTVVGHDPQFFAQQSLAVMKVPVSLTDKFTQP